MAQAENKVELASIFQPGGVLQQQKLIPVWGWGTPNSIVTGELNGVKVRSVSNDRGYFLFRFPAMPAGGPYELKVTCGSESSVVNDLWIGEVFLFSGQSNMEFNLASLANSEERAAAGEFTDPSVSCFVIPADPNPVRRENVEARWIPASGGEYGNFSALGYYFGHELAKQTGTKVGVICAARGGSGIECWISPQGVLNSEYLRNKTVDFFLDRQNPAYYENLPEGTLLPDGDRLLAEKLRALAPETIENIGLEMGWHESGFDDTGWDVMELPDSWTVAGHNYAGVFWFRKDIDVPAEYAGKDLTLSLGSLDKGDITWFNGTEVGRTGDGIDMATWNTPRIYTVPGELVRAGRNTIAVRVTSTVSIALDGGFMGPADSMYWQQENGGKNTLAGEWYYSPEQYFGQEGALLIPFAGPGLHNTASTLFENKIYPILPYALRSVVWYQGECNAIPESDIYDTLLTTLIKDWRYQFCDPDLEFMVIQLPGWQEKRRFSCGSTWAMLREKQFRAALANDAAIVVTADTGDVWDLHPHDKDVVAARAAKIMAAKLASGKYPDVATPVKAERKGENIVITVEAKGLNANAGNGFAVVDEYGEVVYPDFAVSGNTIILSGTDKLPESGTVYYNWSNFPLGRITDDAGYMLTGFRLDF